MKKYPYVEVCFVIEGETYNIKQFTDEVGIIPSKARDVKDWPLIIKSRNSFPRELSPRCEWCICEKMHECNQIDVLVNKIMLQLKGKEHKIVEWSIENELKKTLIITIHADAMKMPEMLLPSSVLLYFAQLDVDIAFDIYTYSAD